MNNMFSGLPTPTELANMSKVKTVTMSLRIKETTKAFFDEQAATFSSDGSEASTDEALAETGEESKAPKARVTSSSLMNNLLDRYAESFSDQSPAEVAMRNLRSYLTGLAPKLAQTDDATLIKRIYRDNFYDEFLFAYGPENVIAENVVSAMALAVTPDCEVAKDVDRVYVTAEYCDSYSEIVLSDSANNAYIEYPQDATDGKPIFNLIIPRDKAVLVMALVDAYNRKFTTYIKDSEIVRPSIPVTKKLIDAVNTHDNHTQMALAIANILADYAEQIYE